MDTATGAEKPPESYPDVSLFMLNLDALESVFECGRDLLMALYCSLLEIL